MQTLTGRGYKGGVYMSWLSCTGI